MVIIYFIFFRNTALHMAVFCGRADLMELLLQSGSKVSFKHLFQYFNSYSYINTCVTNNFLRPIFHLKNKGLKLTLFLGLILP